MEKIFTMEEIKKRVTPIAQKYGIKKLSLFGSYAKNKATSKSDLDFLIQKGKLTGMSEYADFVGELESEFGLHVDVLLDNQFKDPLEAFEINDAVVLYEQDVETLNHDRMAAMESLFGILPNSIDYEQERLNRIMK